MAYKRRDCLPQAGLEGRYANYFNVGYSAFEVILEFGQFYEGSPRPHMHTRIVTGPAYAKALLEVLRVTHCAVRGGIRRDPDGAIG